MGSSCYAVYYYLDLKEWYIYGSESDGRISTLKPYANEFTDHLHKNAIHLFDQAEPYAMKDTIIEYQANTIGSFTSNARITGHKEYEIKDHLGNVRAVISDVKNPHNLASSISSWTFTAEIRNLNSYYPYGMQLPSGAYASIGDYSYGYNGMEKDGELRESLYATLFREGDVGLGRWWNRDPLESILPFQSPYTINGNNPILYIDPLGLFQENPNKTLPPGEEIGETEGWEDGEVMWDGESWEYNPGEVVVEDDGPGQAFMAMKGFLRATMGTFVEEGWKLLNEPDYTPNEFNNIKNGVVLIYETKGGVVLDVANQFINDYGNATPYARAEMSGELFGSLALLAVPGPGGKSKVLRFTGLIRNKPLKMLTHNEIYDAFLEQGIILSNHAIKRLKDKRTTALGFKTPKDIESIINRGTDVIMKDGTPALEYKDLQMLYDQKTKRIITFRPK